MNKLLLVCLLVLAPLSIASADLKIAVVDFNKAFDQYYKTKQDLAELNAKATTYKKEIQDSMADFQRMQDEAKKLNDSANDPTLSAASRDDKKKALDQKNQDLLALRNKIQEMDNERSKEIQDDQMRSRKDIVQEVTTVVSGYAAPHGYDLVIDKSSLSGFYGSPILLYYNPAKLTDVTADIITLLNKAAPAGSGAAPSGAAIPANQ